MSATSLVCNIPTKQEALTELTVTMQVSKPFYNLEYYYLEIGEGSLNEKQSTTFKHAFVVMENFTTNPKAVLKNNETGQRLVVGCANSIQSFLPPKGLSFSCPQYVPTNVAFKCSASFTQGFDVDLEISWYPGSAIETLPLPGN
jgi:hypothetical protein